MSLSQSYDHLFKIIIIGDSSVGKSSLLMRYTEGTFSQIFLPTIGVDFKIKTLDIDGKKIKLQIWDTAGQERYKGITASYYKGAHGVMIIYDISDIRSFNNVHMWIEEIQRHGDQNIVKMLVGNKSDLTDQRLVRKEMGSELANYKNMAFMETSAKDTLNVDEAFLKMCENIKKQKPYEKNEKKNEIKTTLIITQETSEVKNLKQQKNCC